LTTHNKRSISGAVIQPRFGMLMCQMTAFSYYR